MVVIELTEEQQILLINLLMSLSPDIDGLYELQDIVRSAVPEGA